VTEEPRGRRRIWVSRRRLAPAAGGGGLVIGRDRHERPFIVRLLRTEPTRVTAVGSLAFMQLLICRIVALGAHVIVQTSRPHSWNPFIQYTGIGRGVVDFAAPGEQLPPPAYGATTSSSWMSGRSVGPSSPGPVRRCATVVLRQEIAPTDVELLASADVTLMQPLTVDEAMVAAPALRSPAAEQWMTRISSMMITVASHGVVRWATLSPTELEQRMLSSPVRF
jgi:hypothetical protein